MTRRDRSANLSNIFRSDPALLTESSFLSALMIDAIRAMG